jgi:DNA adenine methylase
MENRSVRPLLKWAGGKRQLLPELRPFYPTSFNHYWEPFLGSGAVFFDLYASGRLAGHPARLLDSNPDLIACYERVRDEPDAVIAALHRLAAEHRKRGSAHYYEVRDRRFNPLRIKLASQGSPQGHRTGSSLRAPGGVPTCRGVGRLDLKSETRSSKLKTDLSDRCGQDTSRALRYTPELAAMLIYLNRTGFNGLFRLNAAGGFNVPAGRYEKPRICDSENLRGVANALSQPGVSIACLTFDRVLDEARAGDFLYFDPPYAPVSRTAQFTSYTAEGFGHAEQRRLQTLIVQLAHRGCQVLLSNSTALQISELYERDIAAKEAGLRCYRVPARRAINSKASRRGPVTEFLITNIRPRVS